MNGPKNWKAEETEVVFFFRGSVIYLFCTQRYDLLLNIQLLTESLRK